MRSGKAVLDEDALESFSEDIYAVAHDEIIEQE
jgi:hypothetical protein